MPRKKDESLSSILIRKPWYWSVIFSAVLFALMRYGAPLIPVGNDNSLGSLDPLFKSLLQTVSRMAPLALIFLIFIPFSLFHSFRRKRNLDKQRDVDSIKALTWREFEWLVSEAYRRQGWTVTECLDRGADGGIDLVLTKGSKRWLVQCKQWRTKRVGAPKVRELFGVVAAEKGTGGIFVTSGSYTRDALAFAKGKPLTLIDGTELLNIVKGVQKKSAI